MYSSLGIYANLGLNQLKTSQSYNVGKPLTMLQNDWSAKIQTFPE